jgi:glycosyltransferase involved in cell wall biosynthesis
MKISVILPCYNGAATIAVQLEALVNQQWGGEWELVVVNNGSTDDSMKIVEQYRDRLPDLKIVQAHDFSKPRLGVAHSYNTGVKAASGDVFCFCEADDEVSPGWLAAMAEALCLYDSVAGPLEYTRLNEPWLVAACNYGKWYQSEGLMDSDISHPPHLPFSFGCNLGMKRSVYEAVGDFNLEVSTAWDADYCWRIQLAGFPLHFAPDAVVHYRLRHSYAAMYRQAQNWGWDHVPLLLRYSDRSFGWYTLLKELVSMSSYLVSGIKLYLMSTFNIRRGRGGFALWCWGMGFKIGCIKSLLANDLLPALFSKERSGVLKPAVPSHVATKSLTRN